jgi:hypothetical protein
MSGRVVSAFLGVACVVSCVDERAPGDPSAEVLLICGEAPRPSAVPSITYLLQGGVWTVMMSQSDLEALMVDQDRLVSWERCATEAIVLIGTRVQ